MMKPDSVTMRNTCDIILDVPEDVPSVPNNAIERAQWYKMASRDYIEPIAPCGAKGRVRLYVEPLAPSPGKRRVAYAISAASGLATLAALELSGIFGLLGAKESAMRRLANEACTHQLRPGCRQSNDYEDSRASIHDNYGVGITLLALFGGCGAFLAGACGGLRLAARYAGYMERWLARTASDKPASPEDCETLVYALVHDAGKDNLRMVRYLCDSLHVQHQDLLHSAMKRAVEKNAAKTAAFLMTAATYNEAEFARVVQRASYETLQAILEGLPKERKNGPIQRLPTDVWVHSLKTNKFSLLLDHSEGDIVVFKTDNDVLATEVLLACSDAAFLRRYRDRGGEITNSLAKKVAQKRPEIQNLLSL